MTNSIKWTEKHVFYLDLDQCDKYLQTKQRLQSMSGELKIHNFLKLKWRISDEMRHGS